MKARVIAYYLPQFHPIPENDKAWGPGFTEWTNVAQAKPLFRGHYQPRIPADLGFYDLRLPEVREQQAVLAKESGIEGFCYWHYWFGNGKMLLQRPFEEVLHTGRPDFPFCLAWANHDWTTETWQSKGGTQMIAQQEYPGEADDISHFNYCLPAFQDHRYIRIDGKPLFAIYDPYHFPHISHFISLWRRLAAENGIGDIFFVALCKPTSTIHRREDGTIERVMPNLKSSAKVYNDLLALGFDALNPDGRPLAEMTYQGKYMRLFLTTLQKYCPWLPPLRYNYAKVMPHYYANEDSWENIFPTIMPQWDRSPRSGAKDGIYIKATPENFQKHIEHALQIIQEKTKEHQILFLRSWNEWAEGNYVEPDLKFGHGFLEALKRTIM